MKIKSNCALLNVPGEASGRLHARRPQQSASQDSASRVERMFLAELAARRARLKELLSLVEREVIRENGYQRRHRQARAS